MRLRSCCLRSGDRASGAIRRAHGALPSAKGEVRATGPLAAARSLAAAAAASALSERSLSSATAASRSSRLRACAAAAGK